MSQSKASSGDGSSGAAIITLGAMLYRDDDRPPTVCGQGRFAIVSQHVNVMPEPPLATMAPSAEPRAMVTGSWPKSRLERPPAALDVVVELKTLSRSPRRSRAKFLAPVPVPGSRGCLRCVGGLSSASPTLACLRGLHRGRECLLTVARLIARQQHLRVVVLGGSAHGRARIQGVCMFQLILLQKELDAILS